MAFYKSPIRPFDPVVEDEKDNLAIRYVRDNFDQTGQDSNQLPPAQDQALWQQLTNIQPITQGALTRRWGYQLFGNFNGLTPITRMYAFQNNNTLVRSLVYSSQNNVFSTSEAGSTNSTVSTVYSPIGTLAPRMVDSRNYGYFLSDNVADQVKWDGTSNPVSKWGIASPSVVTTSTSVGPNAPGTFLTQVANNVGDITWTNPSNVLVSDAQFATVSLQPNQSSYAIVVNNFGFSIPINATITGIKAELQFLADGQLIRDPHLLATANLVKSSINPYGEARSIGFAGPILTEITRSFNATNSDLWGVGSTWTALEVNNSQFGIRFFVTNPSFTTKTASVDFVRITVFYSTSTGTIAATPGGVGLVTLTVGRTYYCVFQNSATGHLSDLNPASNSTGPTTSIVINLSTIPVSTDPQVDSKVILATADGGDPSILYRVASIPNANTTYTDNVPETTLILNQQYLFTDPFGNEFGVTFNDPPPNGNLCIKHKGRLWMAQQQNLFFSKSTAELTLPNGFVAGKYEECWPPQNYFDISAGAETMSGLLSDGNVIYMGTQNHIRRIFGDSPSNFQQPEICHQSIGVLNQETWQNVFLEGTPVGFMWLTPDFKVMGSDGNTYLDLGHPIQDVLNSINPTTAQNAHAMFVQQGPYDLYILGIPTGSNTFCDTHCVFDLRNKHWFIWKPTDPSAAMLFNITAAGATQWLFSAFLSNPGTAFFQLTLPPVGSLTSLFSTSLVYQYLSTLSQDRVGNTAIDFTATASTSWLHMGMPTTRKILDEMDIVGDPNLLISIDGASKQADFTSPFSITSNSPIVVGPFQTSKVYLSGKTSRHRYYRLTFSSATGADANFLDAYAIRVIPWNTI